VSRAQELGYLRWKYARLTDPRARAAVAEYADGVYGRDWRTAPEEPPKEPRPVGGFPYRGLLLGGYDGYFPDMRPEHARLLRHIDWLSPKVRRIDRKEAS
jgi:hypothetical protein